MKESYSYLKKLLISENSTLRAPIILPVVLYEIQDRVVNMAFDYI